jgi:hypothetical protein
MSSHHNDLATWAGKARLAGVSTIELDVDTAIAISDQIVEQAERIGELEHELRGLYSGTHAVLPKDRKHAENIITVAEGCMRLWDRDGRITP